MPSFTGIIGAALGEKMLRGNFKQSWTDKLWREEVDDKPQTTDYSKIAQLSVSEMARYRREEQLLNDAWKQIYDYAYRGDGECGFKAFKKAIEEAHAKGFVQGRSEGAGG